MTCRTFRYVPHERVLEFINAGWLIADGLQSCHHGEYSVLMEKHGAATMDFFQQEKQADTIAYVLLVLGVTTFVWLLFLIVVSIHFVVKFW